MKIKYAAFSVFFYGMATLVHAKGLDELEAPAPSPKEESAPEKEEGPVKIAEMQKSPLSEKLTDRLYIGSSFSYAITSASKGEWGSGGMGDIFVGLKSNFSFLAGTTLDTTLRYSPIDVTVVNEMKSYRGVIEVYNLGALTRYKMLEKLDLYASLELGYCIVNLKSLDRTKDDAALEDNGVNVTLGGGADRLFFEKVKAGPKIYYSFGRFQILQLAAAASFIF